MNDAEPLRFRLTHKTARKMAITAIATLPDGWGVVISPPKRSDAQSDKMHAMLGDIAKQVEWCGAKMNIDSWKRVATAMLKKDKFVRDVNDEGEPGSGLIVIGASTARMSTADVGLIIDWLEWFGAKHNVAWSDPRSNVTNLSEARR